MDRSTSSAAAGGFPLGEVDEIGSTSEELKWRAEAGGGEQALLARRQTGGRGRLGRPWVSVDGNLYLSVLLRPEIVKPGAMMPGHWSLLAAVALAEAVAAVIPAGTGLRLKWPNDLMLGDGKLAGILLEASGEPSPWLVIGFGVNLAGAPEGLGRAVACVADVAPVPTPAAMARRVLDCLAAWRVRYETAGFAPVRAAWLVLGHRPGEQMLVGTGASQREGRFLDIGMDGALLLEGSGGPMTIVSGEVV